MIQRKVRPRSWQLRDATFCGVQVDRCFIQYEEPEQIVRFASANAIEALSGRSTPQRNAILVWINRSEPIPTVKDKFVSELNEYCKLVLSNLRLIKSHTLLDAVMKNLMFLFPNTFSAMKMAE